MKETKLKIRLFISALIGMAFLTSCQQNPEEKASVSQESFKYETPTFNAEDIYFISEKGSNGASDVIFQFETSTSGIFIVNQYTNYNNEVLGSNNFTYKSGNVIANGTKILSFMTVDDYMYAFGPESVYKRESGQTGLFAKFAIDGYSIEFASDGTATVSAPGKGTQTTKYENSDGIISLSGFKFYYLEEGYLVSKDALSSLKADDKIELHLGMNTYAKGSSEFASFIKGLPDGLDYKLVGLKERVTNLKIVYDILDNSPNKKFAIFAGEKCFDSSSLNFANRTNLYEINFGSPNPINKGDYKSIPDKAFENCTNLKTVHTGIIKRYGKNCFKGCTSLEEIYICAGFTGYGNEGVYIESNAFLGCTGLKKVNFEPKIKKWKIGGDYYNSDSFTEISEDMSPENAAKLLTETYVDKCWWLLN